MSKRHARPSRLERAPKRERRLSTHRERQAVRASLGSVADPAEVILPEVVHHGPRSAEEELKPRRRRHWKLKDWKRRTARRRERALALRASG